jgi:hypothetical protein
MDFDHRHGGKVPAHDLAIGSIERLDIGQIRVAHIPPHDGPRRGAALRQHRGEVRERHLIRLCDESLREAAMLVLTDQPPKQR